MADDDKIKDSDSRKTIVKKVVAKQKEAAKAQDKETAKKKGDKK